MLTDIKLQSLLLCLTSSRKKKINTKMMGHFEKNLLSKLPNTWLNSNMQGWGLKNAIKTMNFNFRGSQYSLPNGAEYSQFTCLTLSLDHGAVIQPKRRMMTKTRKRHKIISLLFLHSIGSGLSGRFSLLLRWRRNIERRGGQD